MQEYSVKVTLPDGQVMAVTASESDTLEAVADRFKDYYEDDIILGIVNGRLRELNKKGMAGVHTEEVLCCFCRGLYTMYMAV